MVATEAIIIGLAQLLFTALEQQGLSEAEAVEFIMNQRIKFRTENRPENLPKPPAVDEGG